ncbi:hypothetical protein BDW69DRAFT_170419 [Aspergillus filifer]
MDIRHYDLRRRRRNILAAGPWAAHYCCLYSIIALYCTQSSRIQNHISRVLT